MACNALGGLSSSLISVPTAHKTDLKKIIKATSTVPVTQRTLRADLRRSL